MALVCFHCKKPVVEGNLKCDSCGRVAFNTQQVSEDVFYNFKRTLKGPKPIHSDAVSFDFLMPPTEEEKDALPWVTKFFTCGLLRPGAEEDFQKTVVRLMEFKHPSVASIAGSLLYDGAVILLYEVPKGPLLESMMANIKPDSSQAQNMARQVMDVATAFQQSNLIHGNINPGSIKAIGSHLYLCDLGTVDVLELLDVEPEKIEAAYPGYKSPEQLNNPKEPDFSWDRYGAAALAYKLVTGEDVVEGADDKTVGDKVKRGELNSPGGLNLGKRIFFKKAFNTNISKRFASMENLDGWFSKWPKIDMAGKIATIAAPVLIAVLVLALLVPSLLKRAGGDDSGVTETVAPVIVETATLTFEGEPADAEIFINDKSYGSVEKSFEMETGELEYFITAPGYSPARGVVTLAPNDRIVTNYRLRKQLYFEDFTDNHNGWFAGKKGGINAYIEDGFYVIQGEGIVEQKNSVDEDLFELRCSMSLEQVNPGSEAGLIFLKSGRNNYIQIMANSNKGCFIDRRIGGNYNPLGDLIGPCRGAQTLNINVKSLGSKLVVAINGKRKTTSTGSAGGSLKPGDVAFKVFADAVLRVDYIELLELE